MARWSVVLSTELMTLPSRSRVDTVPAPVTTTAESCAGAVTSVKLCAIAPALSVSWTVCDR